MKKRNIALLSLICLISFGICMGMIYYSFVLQNRKNSQNDLNDNSTNIVDTSEANNPSITPKVPSSNNNTDIQNDKDNSNASSNEDNQGDKELGSETTPTPNVEPSNSPDQIESDLYSKIEDLGASQITYPIVLSFAGDINFDENSKPVERYDKEQKGILGGLSSNLVKEMTTAHIMMLNNEFSYSTRGTKAADKSYTFRANPERVNILKEMGVDIVSLANNHAMDYGEDALLDTFDTLDSAQIEYIGAGNNFDRAKSPIYYHIGDKTIAYVAASRVVFSMDWYATNLRPGMIGTYDPTEFLAVIREAKANSDYVVAYLHWGVERNNYPENYQKTMAKQYIDAGADAVIGCHPHVLQGIEYYKGKPIAYSLGNFWFNSYKNSSVLLKLILEETGMVKLQLLPAKTENTYTSIIKNVQERKDYFKFMTDISYGVTIDEDGFVSENE